MDKCARCGGAMENGRLEGRAGGYNVGHVVVPTVGDLSFVMARGEPTSMNLGKAFQQGLRGESPEFQRYEVEGRRCASCGLLELYAVERP